MKSFSELLQSSQFVEGVGQRYTVDDGWMQGRAIYGGLSTALCLDGVLQQIEGLPPLRSANVNFIGPASEQVDVKCTVLRRGKSVAFVRAQLMGEQGLINESVFSFGAARESQLNTIYQEAKPVTNPAAAADFFTKDGSTSERLVGLPAFTQHFDVRLINGSRPFSGTVETSFELWVKHKDAAATSISALVALADMPPPAVAPIFKKFAPISSMSWMFNLLTDDLSNDSGWWRLGMEAEHARQGYSSQNMTIHNDRGELVMVGRQNVAIFY